MNWERYWAQSGFWLIWLGFNIASFFFIIKLHQRKKSEHKLLWPAWYKISWGAMILISLLVGWNEGGGGGPIECTGAAWDGSC